HLDTHMGTLQLRPEFFDVYLELAVSFGLPLRMVSAATERYVGFPARAVAADAGAVFTDHIRLVPGVGSRQIMERDLRTLRPGVTEFLLHPAVDSAELRSLATDDWKSRVDDHHMICKEDWVRRSLDEAGGKLNGHRPAGVPVLTRERLSNEEVFDIALSHQGIEIRRPGRAPARMSWNRVSHWEIEQ